MSHSNRNFDQIESYINHQMNDEERLAFEQQMISDKTLADAYALQMLDHEAMEKMLAKELKSKFSAWKTNTPSDPFEQPTINPEKSHQRSAWSRYKWWIAGVVLPILSVALYLLMMPKHFDIKTETTKTTQDTLPKEEDKYATLPKESSDKKTSLPDFTPTDVKSSEDLVYVDLVNDAYSMPQDLFSELKSGELNTSSSYYKSVQALSNKNYPKALKILGPSSAADESNIRYLRGHILYNMKNYKAAAVEFEAITKDELLPNYQDAKWYHFLSVAAQFPHNKKQFDKLVENLMSDEDFEYKAPLEKLVAEIKEIDN
jgi:tetratricopeptide (TPR) repeat protein